jgi:two-component system cell cycle response regulator CtrA
MNYTFESQILEVNGAVIHLTEKECSLFARFLDKQGETLSKDSLMNYLYASEHNRPAKKIVDVFVCKLRSKLKAGNFPGAIETLWGKGYVMRLPESVEVAA